MFVSLLEVTLGIGLIALAFACFVMDNRHLSGRIDQIDFDVDRNRDTHNARLERIEDWIKHLDERTRRQAGATPLERARFVVHGNTVTDSGDPGTVPTVVPGPSTEPIPMPTQPDMIAIQVQSALIETTVPRGDSDDAKARKAAWVESELERIRARIDAATKESA